MGVQAMKRLAALLALTASLSIIGFAAPSSASTPEGAAADLAYAMAWVKAAAEHEWYSGIVRAQAAAAASSGGGYNGPHSDAWWMGVAQCEQGGRNDEYFGYFSWMDGSAAGLTWDEQVAKSNDLLARAGKEVGPWAASCVAAGYRASPGG